MYNKILSEISQKYYQQNYPNDGQRFVAWYLRNIHNLDTYETKDCINYFSIAYTNIDVNPQRALG